MLNKSILLLIFLSTLIFAYDTDEFMQKVKKICKADVVIVSAMDPNKKEFIAIDSTYADIQETEELKRYTQENIEAITKRSLHQFGTALRPVVLAYLEKMYPDFESTEGMLTTKDYNAFGIMVAKFLPIEKLYEPFKYFGMNRYSIMWDKPIEKDSIPEQDIPHWYKVVTNGKSARVDVEEIMKAYSEILTNPDYSETRSLLINNFLLSFPELGGAEYITWQNIIGRNGDLLKAVNKSLFIYINENGKDYLISLIAYDIKNDKCQDDYYFQKNFTWRLMDSTTDIERGWATQLLLQAGK